MKINNTYKFGFGAVEQYAPTNLIQKYANKDIYTSNSPKTPNTDTYISSSPKNKSYKKTLKTALIIAGGIGLTILAFKGFSKISSIKSIEQTKSIGKEIPVKAKINTYRETLADGLSEKLGIKVSPESLKCVKDKNEFIKIIDGLTEENYICNAKNMAEGIFKADLHSHSNYSDGKAMVKDILDEAAKYGDDLYKKTKSKFTFALSDHDGVDGVVEALKLIAQEPEKYKHINFIPAVELSFVHMADKTTNPTETSEVLAYCINPFNENITKMLNNLHNKRRKMITKGINSLSEAFPNVKFSINEFSKYYNTDLAKDMYSANLHWRVHHYGQTKLALTNLADKKGINPEKYYDDIMSKVKGRAKALGHLKDQGLIPSDIFENNKIIDIRKSIEPVIQYDNSIIAQGENTLERISNAFKTDKNTVFALAHPYYMTERRTNPKEFVESIKNILKGKLIGTESYHQAYSENISADTIKNFNSICENIGLKPLGGRDNHLAKLFNQVANAT